MCNSPPTTTTTTTTPSCDIFSNHYIHMTYWNWPVQRAGSPLFYSTSLFAIVRVEREWESKRVNIFSRKWVPFPVSALSVSRAIMSHPTLFCFSSTKPRSTCKCCGDLPCFASAASWGNPEILYFCVMRKGFNCVAYLVLNLTRAGFFRTEWNATNKLE